MGLGYMTPCTPNSPPSKSSTLAYYRPNVEGERIGKLLTYQGFLYASPCWSRPEPCNAQKQGKVFAVGNGSQLGQGRQKIFAKGRVGIPILSETLAEGQRPQVHTRPRLRQRQSLQPPHLPWLQDVGAGAGDSLSHLPPRAPRVRDDGSTPREAATPPAAFPPSESPLAQKT